MDWNLEFVQILKFIVIGLICFITFCFFYYSSFIYKLNETSKTLSPRLESRMKKSSMSYFNYNETEKFLKQNGVTYMFPFITPISYLFIKILLSLAVMTITYLVSGIIASIPAGLALFFLPDLLFHFSNSSDNDQMMTDIKVLYDTLRIQTKAGVHLQDSLCECYRKVKQKRLKKALELLNNDLIITKDIEKSIDRFNTLFSNKYIDTLCITIRQATTSGRSVQILTDVSTQINDLQKSINLKIKESLERKIQALQLLVFVAILAICIYALATDMLSSLSVF